MIFFILLLFSGHKKYQCYHNTINFSLKEKLVIMFILLFIINNFLFLYFNKKLEFLFFSFLS